MQALLTKKYVCTWKNIEGEAICGGSYGHAPGDKPGECMTGDGEHNTQLCVFSPDGELLDVMAGFQTAKELEASLKWVLAVQPIAMDKYLPREVKKRKLVEALERRWLEGRPECLPPDAKFLSQRMLLPWTEFDAKDLVSGRGFGDHFFGRYKKDMPGKALGKVPDGQQRSVDQERCEEIRREIVAIKPGSITWGNASEPRRSLLRLKIDRLTSEHETIQTRLRAKSKSGGAAKAVG